MNKEVRKIGVYLCSGCGIGQSLDINSLQSAASENNDISIYRVHSFLCRKEYCEIIHNDIADKELNSIVIAACSPRVKTTEFSFDPAVIVERVNLREQVIWCNPPNEEDTQMLAEDYLRMGIAKALVVEQPEPFISSTLNSDILVVGAGISGITSAIESAKAGYRVVIVEKEAQAGGWSSRLLKQVPYSEPFGTLQDPIIHEKIKELQNFKNITLLSSSEIKEISGQPGEFTAYILNNNSIVEFKVASIILATGWEPYDAANLKEFGYNIHTDVVTNVEMEEMAKSGKIVRPSNGQTVKSALFIQCAGSRDKNHLPYCSAFCCATSLKQAKYIRNLTKDTKLFVVYKDIRMPGKLEYFYKEIQKDEQIFLTKGTVSEISEKNNQLLVTVKDTLIDDEINIKVDLVVLATGMTPRNSEDLNLTYRQGKGLPGLKYNFPDSHFICFPYETRRTGIYAAGAIRTPGTISACIEDATGAALKAIQCIENTKRGESVHPRSGDIGYPELYMQRCTDCKRCTEECPFGAYDETEKGTPLPNPYRCRSCGICMGSCPERIINFKDFSINAVSSMIKAVHIPDEFEEKPRILAFVCENDAYPAFDMAGINRLQYSAYVRIIPVRCIGSVNNVWISDALSQGFDGILQIGCKPGDDYQCHFIHGSELTETRGENIKETLQTMMLEPERIRTEFIEINEFNRIPEMINDYLETIVDIGPNPFKDI